MKTTQHTRGVTAVLLLVYCVRYCCTLSLVIEPRAAYIRNVETLQVMCRSDQPLKGCQFHLNTDDRSVVMDLTRDDDSLKSTLNARYDGGGLDAGECGIRLSSPGLSGTYVLGCRVRGATGNWVYKDMTFYVNDGNSDRRNPVVMGWNYPHQVVVRADEEFQVAYTLKSAKTDPTAKCSFQVPGVDGLVEIGKKEGNFKKFGNDTSQCGIQVSNTKIKYNGWLWGYLMTDSIPNSFPFPKTTIIVAQYPRKIDMVVNAEPNEINPEQAYFDEGDHLIATCTANNSRPVANMTWYLGEEVIRRDAQDDSPLHQDWVWDYEDQSIVQNISRELSWVDDGLYLICQVAFLEVDEYEGVNDTIQVLLNHKKSSIVPTTLEISDVVIGHNALIVVDTGSWEIARPTFLWRILGNSIREDDNYRYDYRAVQGEQKDGRWIASLIIFHINRADVAKPLLLIAGDRTLRREYLVTINTVDMKLWYLFVTLMSALAVVLVVLIIVYFQDIRGWFTKPVRYNDGRMMYSSDRTDGEQNF